MTPIRRRSSLTRITPYLPSDLAQRLAKHCAAADVTESAAVQAAVRQYLDGTSDKTLIMRRLDRLGRAQERSQRDQEIQTEAFGIFVKIWFGYLPSIPQEGRKAALASAEARFRQFMDLLGRRIAGPERFVDKLPREPVADADELAGIAESPASPTASEEEG